MPRRQLTPQQLRELRTLARQWGKILARRAFGDAGPGRDVDLDAMEQVAQAAAEGITEGTLQTCLEQQAQRLGPQQPCAIGIKLSCLYVHSFLTGPVGFYEPGQGEADGDFGSHDGVAPRRRSGCVWWAAGPSSSSLNGGCRHWKRSTRPPPRRRCSFCTCTTAPCSTARR